MRQTSVSATQTLAAFIVDTSYDSLPPSIIEAAKDLILDSLGCTIGGAALTPGRIIVQLFQELGGLQESTVWATGKKLPCLHTTYINAYLANLLDFDDSYPVTGVGHPGATVVPPGLAVAEKIQATGREFLTAVVLGYEISIRIGLAIAPSPERYRQAWGYGFQIFGTTTVASKLLHLDRDATATAFGLAGLSAPVPGTTAADHQGPGRIFTWAKNNYGWTAMGGVLAALKATRGFVADKSILDGESGFWRMAGSDRCDEQQMTANLGHEFLLAGTEHKPYPTCRWTHSSIDALDNILAHHRVAPDSISEIRVRTFSRLIRNCSVAVPEDIVEAQFSLPYLLGLRLHGRQLTTIPSEEDLRNPEILNVARQVTFELDPEAERAFFESGDRPSTVIVKMVTGEMYSETVRSGRGAASQRLTSEELQAKFRGLVEPVVGLRCTKGFLTTIECLDEVQDMRMLAEAYPPQGSF
jgi:2-methylcitrate dehydratase PrpD